MFFANQSELLLIIAAVYFCSFGDITMSFRLD